MLLLVGLAAQGAELSDLERLRIAQVFPAVERIGDPEGDYGVRRLSKGEETLGYAFQTLSVTDIPAYSGKPINLQVILDPQAVIRDAYVLEHHEPILLIGIPEEKLHAFSARYDGVRADQRVVVGRSSDPQAVTVDAVSGATVTVMVVNEIVMRAAHTVAVSLGLIEDRGNVRPKPAQVRQQPAATASWSELLGNGAIRRLQLSRGQIDDAFKGSEAEGIGEADAAHRDEPFIDLYSALLNPPAVGRSLLGDNQYRELMASLKPGEYAFVVLGDGEYSFKGSGYVRGGIFDRVQLRQFGDIISFRDLDYQRLSDVYAEGMPEFREMAIFVARASQRFDPGSPWTLELLVRRQTGPVAGVFTSFELACQTPEEYLERPQPTAEELAALEEAARPLWLRVWYQKSFQVGVLCTALVLLLAILFLQDRLVRRPRLMQRLRTGYLAFTLVYLGWYSLGQLSVVNVLTFVHALFEGFRWELFLSDPLLFILWTFTAASLLLWGRGVFCGWLCPFGALQELLNELARKLRVPQFQCRSPCTSGSGRSSTSSCWCSSVSPGIPGAGRAGRGGGAVQDRHHPRLRPPVVVRRLRRRAAGGQPVHPQGLLPLPLPAGRGPGDPGQGAPVRLAQAPRGMRQALPALCPRMRDPGDPSRRPHRGQRMPLLPRLPDDLPRPGQVPAAGEQAQEAREERAGGQRADTRGEPLTWLPFPDCP